MNGAEFDHKQISVNWHAPAKKDLPMAAIATEEAVTTLEDINILNY